MASETVRVEKFSKREFLPTQAYKQINSGLIGCQKVFAHFWLSQLGACRLGENSRNLRNPRLNICVHPHWPKLFVHIFRPQYSTHWPNTILHTAIAEKYAECLSHSKGLFKNIILFFYISVCRTFSPAPIFKRVELSPKKVEKRLYGSDPPTNTITISGHFLILDFPPPSSDLARAGKFTAWQIFMRVSREEVESGFYFTPMWKMSERFGNLLEEEWT